MKADKTEQLNAIRCKDNRSTLTVVTHIPGVIFWRSRHSRSVNYKKLAFPAAHTHIPLLAVTTMQNKYCYRHITTSSRQGLRSTIMLIETSINQNKPNPQHHKKIQEQGQQPWFWYMLVNPQTPGAPQKPQKKKHYYANKQPKKHTATMDCGLDQQQSQVYELLNNHQ